MSILAKILAVKAQEIEALRRSGVPGVLPDAGAPRGFRAALASGERPRVIAELKRRSPSKGEIRPGFEPVACARAYAAGGAAALSVLTDAQFFGGDGAYLGAVRRAVALPLLRKDFLIDELQIDESLALGADALLLIVAAFAPAERAARLGALQARARGLGLDVLVEVHDEAELDVALAIGADPIGVNNRNLDTFEVDLGTTERLAARIPPGVVLVAESGIFSPQDVARLEAAGAKAVLVGESLMREADLTAALRRLRRTS